MKKTPSASPLSSGESSAIDSLTRRTHSFPFSPQRPASSSAIPFSWEHVPGIPKNPRKPNFNSSPDRIPLPPPIRFESLKSWSEADPFAVAFAECAKEKPPVDLEREEIFRRKSAVVTDSGKRRTAAWFTVGGLGFYGLYVSCKAAAATCSVVDSTVRVRRTGTVNRR
ncbi:uncharacterized protein LOC110037337 [Phalaenopsis equestris]|uniref:uncharacterized protein LOC110034448 n=1 Tax=Phalaenopsis equestris TaxID=78828 RepID=UPI0009E202D6|nr:uncharacterized protein LOC110034448 [Phalaenopsis equestris]XP_020597418.1 uncharacterized protein LOC110037177 [Phalaenopsis equestris]XP_020597624.1 uncharacterized protein LOC110037337 [Phalaenopsis equestris]